jgi:hypothetical protein
MSADFDMSEVKHLEQDLAESTVRVPNEVNKKVTEVGREMADAMRVSAPRRTGELVADIDTEESLGSFRAGSTVKQGFFTEFGTVNMAPRPWAFQHADAAEQALVTSIDDIQIL